MKVVVALITLLLITVGVEQAFAKPYADKCSDPYSTPYVDPSPSESYSGQPQCETTFLSGDVEDPNPTPDTGTPVTKGFLVVALLVISGLILWIGSQINRKKF